MLTGRELARESALAREGVAGERGVGELGAKESRFCLCVCGEAVSRPSGLFLCSTLGSWLAFGDGVARSCFSGSGDAEVGERWPPHWDMNERTAAPAVRTVTDARVSRCRRCFSRACTQRRAASQCGTDAAALARNLDVPRLRGMVYAVRLSMLFLAPTSIVLLCAALSRGLRGRWRLLSRN